MPRCLAPWTNIDIDPQGSISPCCKFRWDRYQQKPCNIRSHSFDQYQQHPVLQQIKTDFGNDRWPAGCDRCRLEEESGIQSKRQLDQQRWAQQYKDLEHPEYLTASLAFGNTCNLTCITCGPWASSKWQTEYRDRYRIDIKPQHFYKENFVQDFMQHAPNVIHIDIPGGEPFLSGVNEQVELLRSIIDSHRASDVSLHYTTNATIMPDQQWWTLWAHFKEIDLQISIDGLNQHNSYIRYPSDWSTVYSNIKQYQIKEKNLANFRLTVSHTVSAYNIYYLPQFVNWCHDETLPRPWLGRVHSPIPMRPSVWPEPAKQFIIDRLRHSEHADCLSWIAVLQNTDDSAHFAEFCEITHWHDQYRGLNFARTFPELAPYIKNE